MTVLTMVGFKSLHSHTWSCNVCVDLPKFDAEHELVFHLASAHSLQGVKVDGDDCAWISETIPA